MAIYCKAMQLSLRYFFNNTLYVFSLFTDDLSIEDDVYMGHSTVTVVIFGTVF